LYSSWCIFREYFIISYWIHLVYLSREHYCYVCFTSVYRWSFLQTTNEYRSKKLNFEYFLTESVNFVQSSSSEMIKFYLVSELILLDINQKYFKCKKYFSMDNSFTKKCCNHNQIDTMNKHHVFYGQCRKSRECLWNLDLDVVYTDNMMNIPIRMPMDHFFWQFFPG
jgi:hypothetical protein